MKRFLCILTVIVLLISTATCALADKNSYDLIYTSENPVPAIAKAARPSVVDILAKVENWDPVTRVASVDSRSSGSGCYFMKDEKGEGGYILTNYHIVADCDVFTVNWLSGKSMDAELMGYDDGTDIAILKFNEPAPEDALPIPLGDSDALEIGELAICIGNPGYAQHLLLGTVTAGIISGLDRQDVNANNFKHSVNVIQTDAAINTGNSGGALLNSKGELVGIPTLKMMYTTDIVFEGLGFCIPINTIKAFIDQIIDSGKVTRPRLGVLIVNIDGPDEPMKKYPPIGVQVTEVEPGTPSEFAGLMVYDIITEVNGVRVRNITDIIRELDQYAEGETLVLKVYRYYDENGELTGTYQELNLNITLQLLD